LRPRGFLPNGTSNPEAALDSLAVAASHSVAAPTPSVVVGFRERAGSDRFQQRFTQSQPAPASPVLNSFQVEQVGRQLRLVDADGSVYPANLEVAIPVVTEPAAPAAPTLGPASRGPGLRGVQGPVLKRAGQEVEVRQEMPPTQVLALNAAGTNQQLQQRVVFAGNLVVTNLAGVPWVSEPTQLTTNWESLNQIFRNASVRGRVTVGGTNQYVVEAVPAGR
jgi:hypothetical protein